MLFDVIQIENLGVLDAFRFNTLSKQALKNCSFVSKFLKMDPTPEQLKVCNACISINNAAAITKGWGKSVCLC